MAVMDIVFLLAYFAVLGGIGYWSSKRSLDSSKSYFLAGGNIGWLAIGASLFASNISAEHFIGLAGSGAAGGMAVGQFELLACFCLLILGWVFVPLYLRTGVFTMPEAYISPPIAVVFLLGVSWKRINGKGALACLLGGFALGALRFVAETGVKAGWFSWQPLVKLASINFLHFAILLAAVCAVIMVLVSLFTAPPTEDKLGIFAEKVMEKRIAETHKTHRINVLLSVLLVVTVLAIWAYFSPLVFTK